MIGADAISASPGSPGPRGAERRVRSARSRANAAGTTTSETNGAAAMPSATGVCPLGNADRDGDRKGDARGRLHQHEAAVEREVLVAGQPAAGEVAGRVGERAGKKHVVERAVVIEDVVDELAVQGQRDRQEGKREPKLDQPSARAADAARARVLAGRRSCATRAVRSAGR